MSKKLLISEAVNNCKVTVETPYGKNESDSYLVFLKKDGSKGIEINNLDIDDLNDFIFKLKEIVENNKEYFEGDDEGE